MTKNIKIGGDMSEWCIMGDDCYSAIDIMYTVNRETAVSSL